MPPRPNRKEYRRVRKEATPADESKAAANEIRVVATRGQRQYIAYAIELLSGAGDKEKHDSVVISGMGAAVYNAVNIAEVLKRRVAGLHQTTDIGSQAVTDKYEATAEGKDAMTVERKVSTISIVLSTKPLDKKHVGYQAPIDASLVKEQEDRPRPARKAEAAGGEAAGRGAGRGGRGGRGRGGRGAAAPAADKKKEEEKPARGGRGGARGGRGGRGAAAKEEEKPARGGRGGARGGRGGRGGAAADEKPREDRAPRGGRGGARGGARAERGGRGGYSK